MCNFLSEQFHEISRNDVDSVESRAYCMVKISEPQVKFSESGYHDVERCWITGRGAVDDTP